MAHYSDSLEKLIADALTVANIKFLHESQNKSQLLDFFLPDYGIFIEIKQYHANRISKQMATQDNVIAIQGKESIYFFIKLLMQNKEQEVQECDARNP